MPKITPMVTEMPKASGIDQGTTTGSTRLDHGRQLLHDVGHGALQARADQPDDRPAGQPAQDAGHPADDREGDRLDEELADDVAAFGAQRTADADFAGPLGDRGQHDVHDADAAHDQRDGGDQAHEDDEHHPRGLGLLQQFQRHGDAVVLGRGGSGPGSSLTRSAVSITWSTSSTASVIWLSSTILALEASRCGR